MRLALLSILVWLWAEPCLSGESLFFEQSPFANLSGATGLWDAPTARVLPDWTMRAAFSQSGPYRSFSAAAGFWDRLELHGRITEVEGVDAFPGEGFGDYKDRSAGLRLVLLHEDGWTPQLALGADDVTGTGLFASRYVTVSRRFGDMDMNLGLGQGVLAGDQRLAGGDAMDLLLASPFRETGIFGGLEWELADGLVFAAEYSSLDYETMFGYGRKARHPFNFGLKYKVLDYLDAYAAVMRGRDAAFGLALTAPLHPEGVQVWKRPDSFTATEKQRFAMVEASNRELAETLAQTLAEEGFADAAASAGDRSVWVQAVNSVSLSSPRALARMGRIADQLAPARITTLHLNLLAHGKVRQSLRVHRSHLRDYLASRIDTDTFLAFAELDLHGDSHWAEHVRSRFTSPLIQAQENTGLQLSVQPKWRTFIGNRRGYFKHKVFLRSRAAWSPWLGGLFVGELETTLYNDYDDVDFDPLEPDPVRTQLAYYERGGGTRLSQLAFDQLFQLPWRITGRLGWGFFESAYAGAGAECFRYFQEGRWGAGLEVAAVRQRDPDRPFQLGGFSDKVFTQAFAKLYWQPWPKEGLETAVTVGRFLAGDVGVRLDLRRTFRHFTVGFWYTVTDTSGFTAPENQGYHEKGVYIRVPLSLFTDTDAPGHVSYGVSSFTRDAGQSVRQPRTLFPVSNAGLPVITRQHLEEMRDIQP